MNTLHIIIPTNRREFISQIVQSVYDAEPHGLEIRMHLMFQSNRTHHLSVAVDKANEATDMITSGWIWFLSDDNKINPKLFRRITELINQHPEKECIVFSEEHHDPYPRILRASPNSVNPAEIGGCQYVIKRELIGSHRHDWEAYGGLCDGYFIRDIFRESPEKFLFIDEVLMTYDAYFWKEYEHSTVS